MYIYHRSGKVASGSSVKVHHQILLIWICDQNFIDEAQAHACTRPGKETTFSVHVDFTIYFISTILAIQEFMHGLFPEDHTVQWANTNHVGFGLLGEQGVESIHAKFNRLGLAFAPISKTACRT